MKLGSYNLYNSRDGEEYKEFTFEFPSGYSVRVRVEEDGTKYIRSDDGITFEEVREVMAMIDSGKLEIEIGE